jgi:Xaa-Pro aminopeptidase
MASGPHACRTRGRRGDPTILHLLTGLRPVRTRGQTVPVRLEDPSPLLHDLRLRRAPAELACQRRACEIASEAHLEAMRYARPGMYEYEV